MLVYSSVANTAAKSRNWATFDPVLTTKNGVRRCLAKDQLHFIHVSLWAKALIWRRSLRGKCAAVWRFFCVGNTYNLVVAD